MVVELGPRLSDSQSSSTPLSTLDCEWAVGRAPSRARDEDHCVDIAIGDHAFTCDLTLVVDELASRDVHGCRAGQSVQVIHRSVLPQPAGSSLAARTGIAHHLIAVIDADRRRARGSSHRPEICHRAIPPEKGMVVSVLQIRPTDNVSRLVQPPAFAIVPAKRPQIDHGRPVPEKRVVFLVSGQVAGPHHSALVVHVECGTAGASERSQVTHHTVAPQEWIYCRLSTSRIGGGIGVGPTSHLSTLVQ